MRYFILQEKFQIELQVSSFSQFRSYINSMVFFLIRCWISTRIKQLHPQCKFSSIYKNKKKLFYVKRVNIACIMLSDLLYHLSRLCDGISMLMDALTARL